jgi:hypothetical protein
MKTSLVNCRNTYVAKFLSGGSIVDANINQAELTDLTVLNLSQKKVINMERLLVLQT